MADKCSGPERSEILQLCNELDQLANELSQLKKKGMVCRHVRKIYMVSLRRYCKIIVTIINKVKNRSAQAYRCKRT